MNVWSSLARTLIFTAALLFLTRSIGATPPTVRVSGSSIHLEGVTRGGSVVLLIAAHEPSYYMSRIATTLAVISDDDNDGAIDYDLTRPIPLRTLCIAVDLRTGETGIASPTGFMAEPLPTVHGSKPIVTTPGRIEVARFHTQVLLVRPGKGAWSGEINGQSDARAQRVDGVSVDTAKLRPLRRDFVSSPGGTGRGDVIVVIDPVELQYAVTTIVGEAN